MYSLVFGVSVLAATAVTLWLALPIGGKIRPWVERTSEPGVAVAIAVGIGISIILIGQGVTSILAQP